MDELPQLAELNEELKDKGIRILGLNVDARSAEEGSAIAAMVQPYFDNVKSSMKVIFIEDHLGQFVFSRQQVVPYSFFVDSEGNVLGEGYVGSKSKEDWTTVINEEYSKVANKE